MRPLEVRSETPRDTGLLEPIADTDTLNNCVVISSAVLYG